MEHPTDLVDAYEVIKDQKAKIKKLEAEQVTLAKQWDELYEENLILKSKLEKDKP